MRRIEQTESRERLPGADPTDQRQRPRPATRDDGVDMRPKAGVDLAPGAFDVFEPMPATIRARVYVQR